MSYGTNAAQGFVETIPLTGASWNTATSVYPIASAYATAIYTGDPVAPVAGTGKIGIGVAGAGVYGVFKGVIYLDATNQRQFLPYWPAAAVTFSGDAEAYVIDDPNVEFNIQTGAVGAAAANINKNANFVTVAGTTPGGISKTYLDMATVGDEAAKSCKILRLAPVPDAGANTIGLPHNIFGVAYNNVIVTFNNHIHKGGTGTAGV